MAAVPPRSDTMGGRRAAALWCGVAAPESFGHQETCRYPGRWPSCPDLSVAGTELPSASASAESSPGDIIMTRLSSLVPLDVLVR